MEGRDTIDDLWLNEPDCVLGDFEGLRPTGDLEERRLLSIDL